MPELPEVEVVRRGIETWAAYRRVRAVGITDRRSLRRHAAGAAQFAASMQGTRLDTPQRRGKYLWIPLRERAEALVIHLGMSGQVLISSAQTPEQKHLKITLSLEPQPQFSGQDELRFVDQRIFGGMMLSPLVPDPGQLPGGIPQVISHIAPDPLEQIVTPEWFHAVLRRRRTQIKRALLDQTVISGIGNIYADEALFRAQMHYAQATQTITQEQSARLLTAIKQVLAAALEAGGTSFDALYVNVNGASGYFDRSLQAYGQAGRPCPRCEELIAREKFMNRSSYFCPVCQVKR